MLRPRAYRVFAFGLAWLLAGVASPLRAAGGVGAYDSVVIEPAKTSIYIGRVTLTPTPLIRKDATYAAEYKARVVPYFFYNETGRLQIDFSADQLAAIERGERVNFAGRAENKAGEERRIEGFVTPTAAHAADGKIKVRIFVTPKLELIFNTTYRFGRNE